MTNPESEFTPFDEMVLIGDLRKVEVDKQVRKQRSRLKWHFARVAGLEEGEEPEED